MSNRVETWSGVHTQYLPNEIRAYMRDMRCVAIIIIIAVFVVRPNVFFLFSIEILASFLIHEFFGVFILYTVIRYEMKPIISVRGLNFAPLVQPKSEF